MKRRAFLRRAGLIGAAAFVAPKVLFAAKPLCGDLSEEMLERAILDIADFEKEHGRKISKMPHSIFVRPEDARNALEIIHSYSKPRGI